MSSVSLVAGRAIFPTLVNREWPLPPTHSLDGLSRCQKRRVNRRLPSSALHKLRESHVAQFTLKTRSFSLGIQSPLCRSGANGDVPASVKRQQTSCSGSVAVPLDLLPFLFLSQWLLLELPSPQMAMSPPKFVSPGQTILQSPRLIYSHHLKKTLFLPNIQHFFKKLTFFLHFTYF